MGSVPVIKTDFEMDSFFDFSQGNSPSASSSQPGPSSRQQQQDFYNNALSPFDQTDDRQVFAGPSHEYDRFRQQTGLPVGTMANLAHLNQPMPSSFNGGQVYSGYNSGIDDMGFNSGFDSSWSTGIDMDGDMGMDLNNQQGLPAMFFPPSQKRSDDFVDPTSIGGQEAPPSNVGRVYPGMHSQQAQQAAMAKAHAQAQQQRQVAMQQQQQKYLTPQPQPSKPSAGRSRASSYQNDSHTEESISRLLNQMRQNSAVSSVADEENGGNNGVLPHIARMRKEEDDMDEDERLLASEEGKKLSSKERRQLRNKVSARAFRSRRKEYIGQLEGEVAMKTQECNNLKNENASLMEENNRYRGLIQHMLRHPAFTPYINDISNDPNVIAPPSQAPKQKQQVSMAPTPSTQPSQPQDVKPYPDFDASQLQIPQQQDEHVGMAMIPEAPVDLSMLNLNNNFSASSNMNFNYRQPQVFSVTEVPQGPSPFELAMDMVKKSAVCGDKVDYPVYEPLPVIREAKVAPSATSECTDFDENEFPLYANSAVTSAISFSTPSQPSTAVFEDSLDRLCDSTEGSTNSMRAMFG